MKKGLSLILAVVMLMTLCACGKNGTPAATEKPTDPVSGCAQNIHTFGAGTIIQEAYGGYDGILKRSCILCDYSETETYPAEPLWEGNTFTLTITQFTQRLSAIASQIAPDLTVRLAADDWNASTELLYKGEVFCTLSYFETDQYIGDPYIYGEMNNAKLDSATIRYVNLLDLADVEHAPNSFAAIAMTFDPMLLEFEAAELAQFLTETRQEYHGNYLVTTKNGVGYGHGYIQNQLHYSGSIAIHAGSAEPKLCVHDVDYVMSGDGVPSGYCRLCGAYFAPAGDSWVYLTKQKVLNHSNDSYPHTDVVVDNWSDPAGAVYWNALRFWVNNSPGWANMEYIEYSLAGCYDTLSGSIVSCDDSDPSAVSHVEIYLDGNLAFTSKDIGYFDSDAFILDVQGVNSVRIACITKSCANCYCVVTGALY